MDDRQQFIAAIERRDERIAELEAQLSLAESFIPDTDEIWSAYQQALQEDKL
jgi:hypothetical protein